MTGLTRIISCLTSYIVFISSELGDFSIRSVFTLRNMFYIESEERASTKTPPQFILVYLNARERKNLEIISEEALTRMFVFPALN